MHVAAKHSKKWLLQFRVNLAKASTQKLQSYPASRPLSFCVSASVVDGDVAYAADGWVDASSAFIIAGYQRQKVRRRSPFRTCART